MRQTNCRDIKAAIGIQKRRELCRRNVEIRRFESRADRVVKSGCQHPYFAFGARENARDRRDVSIAATAAATETYRDPRDGMTSAELRSELEARTGQSKSTRERQDLMPFVVIKCLMEAQKHRFTYNTYANCFMWYKVKFCYGSGVIMREAFSLV